MRIGETNTISSAKAKFSQLVLAATASLFIHVAASAQSVGDISFDPDKDEAGFQLCNPAQVWQSYELKTNMDETSLMVKREMKARFQPNEQWSDQNAIVRIRFMVNCQGTTGRYRLLALDSQLQPIEINEDLARHLISVARSLAWPVRRAHAQTVDYYHFFSVRITNGRLTDIIQ